MDIVYCMVFAKYFMQSVLVLILLDQAVFYRRKTRDNFNLMRFGLVRDLSTMIKNRIMLSVVYYHEDGIVHLCKKSDIRYVKGKMMARYTDRNWYRASCIFKTKSLCRAQGMIQQLYSEYIMINENKPEEPLFDMKFATCEIFPLVTKVVDCLTINPVTFAVARQTVEPERQLQLANSYYNCTENDMLSFQDAECTTELLYCVEENKEEDNNNSPDIGKFSKEQILENTISILDTSIKGTENFQTVTPLLLNKEPKIKIISNIIIEDVTNCNGKVTKKEFCIFCLSLKSNISRHYITVHKEEEEVKKFLYLPNKSLERLKLIEELRKKGQLTFNINENLNQGKFISVSRRNVDKHDACYYRVCPSCKGYYAKNSIRKHIKLCAPRYIGEKCTAALGRRLEGKVHHLACDVLKNNVLPYMRNDTVTNLICQDSLAIASANNWCKKYKMLKDHAMIRSRLRLLGRFLIAMRSLCEHVKQLSDIFKPQLYQQVVSAINEVAKFKRKESSYCAPGSAHSLGGLLKKVAEVYKIKLISEDNRNELSNLENFLTVFNHEISNDVNRTVRENICEIKRRKGVVLPKTEEIKKLATYLHSNVMKFEKLCKENLTLFNYRQLASYLIIDMQVFNRRRAGELERLLIGDFEAQIFQPDSPGYVCVEIRGKLMRTVPLLISDFNNECIKLLLECRSQLGIEDDNPFVFALPSADDRPKHIRACQLLRQYSAECGVSQPNLLRGTLLRKHAATYASQLDFNDSQVQNLADHLGHETKIFREIYSQPLIRKQLSVARFLENAQELNEENNAVDNHDSSMKVAIESNNSGSEYDTLKISHKRKTAVLLENDCQIPSAPKQFLLSQELNTSPTTPTNNVFPGQTSSGNRHSWSSEEKETVRKLFSNHIDTKTSPSYYDVCMARDATENLKCFNETQILGCVKNMISKEKKILFSQNQEKVPKRWNTEEIKVVKERFKHYIDKRRLPSLIECEDLIQKNSILSSRTSVMVKAWVNNFIRKVMKKSKT